MEYLINELTVVRLTDKGILKLDYTYTNDSDILEQTEHVLLDVANSGNQKTGSVLSTMLIQFDTDLEYYRPLLIELLNLKLITLEFYELRKIASIG